MKNGMINMLSTKEVLALVEFVAFIYKALQELRDVESAAHYSMARLSPSSNLKATKCIDEKCSFTNFLLMAKRNCLDRGRYLIRESS